MSAKCINVNNGFYIVFYRVAPHHVTRVEEHITVKKKKFTQLKFFSYLFALTQLSFIHLIF